MPESALEKAGLLAYKDYYPSRLSEWPAATDRNKSICPVKPDGDLAGRADFAPDQSWSGMCRCYEAIGPGVTMVVDGLAL